MKKLLFIAVLALTACGKPLDYEQTQARVNYCKKNNLDPYYLRYTRDGGVLRVECKDNQGNTYPSKVE